MKKETKMTLNQLVNDWILKKKETLRHSSLCIYKNIIYKEILPFFESHNLTNLNLYEFTNMINQKIKDEKISYRYALNIITLLKSILQTTELNINQLKIIGKNKTREIKSFSNKEVKILINYCTNEINYKKLGILISLFSGIRIGELCALKWEDIDLKNKFINISKTLQRIHDINKKSYLYIGIPKTNNSNRKIPLCTFLYNILKKQKSENDFYVLSNKNKPIEPRNYRKFYDKLNTSLKINKINFHGLRHTFASLCIEAGIDFKTVSELLGHSSIAITMNTYVHLSLNYKRKCIEKMAKLLN